MRPNHCLIILHVFILAVLLFTLKAESEDPYCYPEIKVRRHTVHEALLGENLTINCTVTLCNNSPLTVSWYKLDNTALPVNFNRSPHIKTEWNPSNHLEGISFLIFQNIQRNDSGLYQCRSRDSLGHAINVSVYGNAELTTVTWTTLETGNTTTQDTLWPYVYRVPGVVLFVIIVITILVVSERGCKGVHCARKSKNTPDLGPQPLPGGSSTNQHVLSTMHIYENYSNGPNATSIC
ncbi:uncharacterized protein LOC121891781 [Thunnus maccoyii]|uniref:uncharacterized protein LOC121891781 n=1 Tax=Thunnus maccoyii TaxID=8240 RepID=UPI001C4CDA22|nr:uncharacterized protein LOC121891781 [Thunnus maccoyii]